MATAVDIGDYFAGENMDVAVTATYDGVALPDTDTLTFTVSATSGGAPLVQLTQTPGVSGVWTFTVTPTDLAALTEGAVYYYNVWANSHLLAYGKFPVNSSIAPV